MFPGPIEAALTTVPLIPSRTPAPGLFGRNRTAAYGDPAAPSFNGASGHGVVQALAGTRRTFRPGDARPAAGPARIGEGSITARYPGQSERLGDLAGDLAEPLLGRRGGVRFGNKIERLLDFTPVGTIDALGKLGQAGLKRREADPPQPEVAARPAPQELQPKPQPKAESAPRITIRELGELSEIYESSNQGVATISSGKGDRGGVSYGRYQLSTSERMMAAFLKSQHGKPFAKSFAGTSPGTGEFNARYRKVAASHAEAFDEAQGLFLKEENYDPTEKYARSKGIDTSNLTIKKVLWSQSMQHGPKGNQEIINEAVKKADLRSPESTIRALYDARNDYARNKASPSASTERYEKELPTALKILKRDQVTTTK
jgi:hypothetical protein